MTFIVVVAVLINGYRTESFVILLEFSLVGT